MAISKIAIPQHKRMACGDLSVGFKKGGTVGCMEEGGDVKGHARGDKYVNSYKKGGKLKGKKK